MEEAVTTFIHDSMTSTKSKFNPKVLKFVAEDRDFGNSSFFFFESLVTSGFVD
jgi:hypothetical protein